MIAGHSWSYEVCGLAQAKLLQRLNNDLDLRSGGSSEPQRRRCKADWRMVADSIAIKSASASSSI